MCSPFHYYNREGFPKSSRSTGDIAVLPVNFAPLISFWKEWKVGHTFPLKSIDFRNRGMTIEDAIPIATIVRRIARWFAYWYKKVSKDISGIVGSSSRPVDRNLKSRRVMRWIYFLTFVSVDLLYIACYIAPLRLDIDLNHSRWSDREDRAWLPAWWFPAWGYKLRQAMI